MGLCEDFLRLGTGDCVEIGSIFMFLNKGSEMYGLRELGSGADIGRVVA